MKHIFLILSILIVAKAVFSQQVIVEKIKLTETIGNKNVSEIPRLKDLQNNTNPVVEKINAQILERFMINSFEQDKIEYFTWYDVYFKSEIKENILYIWFSGEYYGAYPNLVEEELYFSLKTGEALTPRNIPFQALFTLSGYLDFLNKYWLKGVKEEFNSISGCADFEPYCSYYDIDNYSVSNNQLSVSLTDDCYPHVAKACSPVYSVKVKTDLIKKYLNGVGKYLLYESDYLTKSPIERFIENENLEQNLENNLFIFGKINDKNSISMAINVDGNVASGFSSYDNNLKKHTLDGENYISTISLTENVNGKITGYIEILISDSYSLNDFILTRQNGKEQYLKGKWINSDKKESYDIRFMEVKVCK